MEHREQSQRDPGGESKLSSDGRPHESGDNHQDEKEADEDCSQELERLCCGNWMKIEFGFVRVLVGAGGEKSENGQVQLA